MTPASFGWHGWKSPQCGIDSETEKYVTLRACFVAFIYNSSQISAQSRCSVPRPPKYKVTPNSSPLLPRLAFKNWPSGILLDPIVQPLYKGTGMKKFPKAVEDYIKYPKLQVLGPSFVKTGDKMRSRNENSKYTRGKEKKRKEKGTITLT